MTGAEAVARFLADRGIAVAFGIPGNQLNDLLFALEREGIALIVARHEGGAAMMAEAYARVSRRPGVCFTIPGPGVANAYAGILEAFNNDTPLLLITVHQESSIPADYSVLFHGFDHRRALAPVTRAQERASTPEELQPALERAFAILGAERPGPVLLEFAPSAFGGSIPVAPAPPATGVAPAPTEAIAAAAVEIRRARAPMILAGEGVHFAGACDELAALAETLGAPVATTTLGKAALSEFHPLSLGSITDMLYSDREVLQVLDRADLLVAVGVKFTQTDTERWSLRIPCPLVHIDSDPAVIGRIYPARVGVAGAVRETLRRLGELVPARAEPGLGAATEHARQYHDTHRRTLLVDLLREVMDQDAILAADINIDADFALARFRTREPWQFLFPGVSLALGYGIPAGIGAKLARPDSKVVVLCGDGGFVMSSPEIATIVKHGLDVAIVIVNDDAYGTVKYRQLRTRGACVASELRNPDLVAFARAYGVYGARVDRKEALGGALLEVVRMKGPAILEIEKHRVLA